MKLRIVTILLCIVSISSIAQSKLEDEAKEFFWGANDTYKSVNEIPEKWKNESAVIIYKNVNYDYHKFGKKVTYKASIRKRIKLLDKAAVEEFSEFSFEKRFKATKSIFYRQSSFYRKSGNILGVKIIKQNGNEIEIDVNKDIVEVDGESKIAIANLEVGDIIDYYYYKIKPYKLIYAYGFDPVEVSLLEEYPIVDFKLFLETENDFFINFNSYNGAPELKEIQTDKNNFRRYELTASNIKKREYPRWFYPLLELPSYKFQVYFARSGKFEDMAMAFLPEKEKIIKKSVSKEEVLDLYDKRFKPKGDIGDIKGFLKDRTFSNDEDKVTKAYYYMRHFYMTRFLEAYYVKEADIMYYPYAYYKSPIIIQSQKQFIRHFTEFLKKQKIKYEIIVTKKRFDGTIDDLLIEKNVNVLLKIHTEKVLYAEFFGPHTNMNEYSPLIEGSKSYLLTKSKNKIDGITNDKLPVSTYDQNEVKKEIEVTIDANFADISFTSKNYFKGYTKSDVQYELLSFSDFVHEDYEKYGTKSFIDLIKKKKNKVKYGNELNALIEKLKKKQTERFEKKVKSDFSLDAIEDYNFTINNNGRYGLDTYFTYTESFKITNEFVKKAGPNYILEIGKLIGGQIELTDKERKRKENIYMTYPKIFNYKIRLNIPEGYTVAGLDKLNVSVDNVAGGFKSTAKIDKNMLVIHTSKYYKHNYEPNSNWSLMVDFLDAAQQFTNEKILLKKQ